MTIIYFDPTWRDRLRWKLDPAWRTILFHAVCRVRGHVPVRRQGIAYVSEHSEYPASHVCRRCRRGVRGPQHW